MAFNRTISLAARTGNRMAATLGVGGLVAVAAFVSMRSGVLTRGADAGFVRPVVALGALTDNVIDVPGEAPSLQAALDAAFDGSVIRLGAGTFVGAARAEGLSVTIVGAGIDRTVVRGLGRAPAMSFASGDGTAAAVTIVGMTVSAGPGAEGAGLALDGVEYDVRDVRFTGNHGGGAQIMGGRGRFSDCAFDGNRTTGSGGAVRAERGDATFVSCTFRGNEASGFGGAVAGEGGTVSLLACTLEGNATRSGAWGGAVYGRGTVFELHGSDFTRNRSIEAGGAVYLLGGIGDVSKCTFESNFSFEAPSLFSRGAGVRIAGSRLCGAQEIALGGDFAADDGNVFDEQCFGDCDQNGVADAEDIERGWAQDRDGNGVPDACDPDCNMNGLPDGYEIGAGFAQDMNVNGLIDICEIRAGLALDVDGDWIPDDAQNAMMLPAAGAAAVGGEVPAWGAEPVAQPGAGEMPMSDPLSWGPGMRSGLMFEQGR
jgi:hypothetical protein